MHRPKILVSACLLGEKVRHDGRDNFFNHPFITKLQAENRLISVCPEVAGGLDTPRPPAHIERRHPLQIITTDQQDVTEEFIYGAETSVELAQDNQCVAALMKSGSPACGNNSVLGGSWSGKPTQGAGVAAQELIHKGIPVFNEEQIDQLVNLLAQHEADILESA